MASTDALSIDALGDSDSDSVRQMPPGRGDNGRRRRKRGAVFRDLVNEADDHEFLRETRDKLIYITDQLDNKGFDWLVFFVAASGFLTGSYQIFVTNTVTPSIQYVYFQDDTSRAKALDFWGKISLLIGTMFGQVLFGFLADLLGRTRLYGIELLIVMFSTIGFAFSSQGVTPASDDLGPSLSVEALFYCWRFVMGIGIGAEYPLSAVITAEWASVDSRARMLAAVFAMQSLGQLCASGAGWSALSIVNAAYGLQHGLETHHLPEQDARALIDRVWRGVVGFGAIPATIAIVFRFLITDPGRYTLEVQENFYQAVKDTHRRVRKKNSQWFWKKKSIPQEIVQLQHRDQWNQETRPSHGATRSGDLSQGPRQRHAFSGMWTYLWKEGNIALLLGTCGSWFLLDVAFYGLGVNSPSTLSLIWANRKVPETASKVPSWNPDPTQPDHSIYDVLSDNAKRLVISSALGSITGSVLLIVFVNRIRRKSLFVWSFLGLFAVLLATALSLRFAFGTKYWVVTLSFYILCQVMFNFGPNTLTFMIPAEIFPTRYRCFFHGISAASGKLGSVLVQIVLRFTLVGGSPTVAFNANAVRLSYVLIGFSFFMLLSIPLVWICIPEIQYKTERKGTALLNKSLEELAPGISAAENDGQALGSLWFRSHRLRPNLSVVRQRHRGNGASPTSKSSTNGILPFNAPSVA